MRIGVQVLNTGRCGSSAGSGVFAACRVVSRVPRTVGKRIRPCPPPGLTTGLPLYFPDSLPHHPRLVLTVPCAMPEQPRCLDAARVFCCRKHQHRPGRGWATGCGAYAVPRSAELVARARQRASCSDSLRLSERSERSSRSEFRNGATRSSTTGYPDRRAGRCIRSRRRWPARGPRPRSITVHMKRLQCAGSCASTEGQRV